MQKFGSGLWRWVKRLIATALLPWAVKITVKIADYVVGDAVATKIRTWESGEGVEAFGAKILYYMANYPMRSTFFVTCAVLAVSAIASAIASWRDDDRKESRGSEVTPSTQDQPPSLGESILKGFPPLNVQLTPSGGKGDRMYLQVKNLDKQQIFHAQCRILHRRNDPNPQRLLTLDLNWERNGNRELEIHNVEICSLYLAHAGQDHANEIEWIEIVGHPESVQSQWAIGNVEPLPEYEVEIIIFGSESKEPYSEQFVICAGRECAIEMVSLTKLKDKKSNIARGIKVHLEVMTPGLRMLWMDRTFLFMHCRVVSPVKTTSIIRVGATLKTSDGKVWLCDCLDDLSQWLLCPDEGADVELESQSLIARFRQSPLVAEVQQGGWLGIQVPFAPTKERLDAITQITITMIDGKEEKHTTKFRSPWPRVERTLIVAKHVRTPNAEW
jgi:hypothetical protein